MIQEEAMHSEQNNLIKKKTSDLLSRQFQQEEREQVLKQNNQVEYDVPSVHHIKDTRKIESNDKQLHNTDYKPFVRSFMEDQAPNHYKRQDIENPTVGVPSGYCQANTDLQTGNVIGCYYKTQPRVTFNCPWDPLTSCKKSNQTIPPLTSLDPHQDQTSIVKCETSCPKTNSNQIDTISGQNIERSYLTQTPYKEM